MGNAQNRFVETLEGRTLFSVLLVDDDKVQFANAAYTSLASAIKAAKSGDTIRVAAGTYRQSITIPAGKDNLTLVSAQTRKAVIDPPDGATAAITVAAKNFSLQRFTINGLKASNGVLLDTKGSSATISDCRIKSVRNQPLNGLQSGFGIAIRQGTATITNNVIDDYQKGGILLDGGYSKATISGNTVVGAGATSVIAQNGILINRNATATISNNHVSANHYTNNSTAAVGISLYRARNVTISNNVLTGNDENINVDFSTGLQVLNNEASGGAYDGFALFRTTGATIKGNHFHDNTFDGIFVDTSSGNTFQGNNLEDNGQFDADDTTTGTGTGGSANTWTGNTIGTKNLSGLA